MAGQVPETVRPRFTPEQCQACDRALRTLVDLESLYPVAEKCGVDCNTFKAVNGQLRQSLEAIRHYFMQE